MGSCCAETVARRKFQSVETHIPEASCNYPKRSTSFYQAPLSMGFPRQECWNWLPFFSPEELANPEIEPVTPTLAGRFFTIWATRKAHSLCQAHIFSDPSRSFSLFLELKVKVKSLSHVWLFATPWTVAYQAPQTMGFSRQEYWSGLPFPSPGDLPHPGIKPWSPAL